MVGMTGFEPVDQDSYLLVNQKEVLIQKDSGTRIRTRIESKDLDQLAQIAESWSELSPEIKDSIVSMVKASRKERRPDDHR